MNLKTEIKLPTYPFSVSHEEKIISFGSCFSENIGRKLLDNKFDVCINPFGILFNPISVCKAINQCVVNYRHKESDLDSNQEIQFSYSHHSSFSSLNKKETLQLINEGIKKGNKYLKKSKTLIITLGTAWVYRLKETNEVVANCYKIPQNQFNKELLSVADIVNTLNNSIANLKEKNPEINIITTISPVRHWKDGVVENQQSKATLHLAFKEINESNDNCHYFPSYELMMDELRDYRFYAKDLLHPSEIAIDYIWEKFGDSFFTEETKKLNKRISQIQKEKNHRPFNPESTEFVEFSKQLVEKENQLHKEFPFLKRG